jgi:hypothetical protein
MVWGFARVAIFGLAFFAGILLTGHSYLAPSGASDFSIIPTLNETAGTSLVVACQDGRVLVNSISRAGRSVQVDCVQSKMVVVRDSPDQSAPRIVPAIIQN